MNVSFRYAAVFQATCGYCPEAALLGKFVLLAGERLPEMRPPDGWHVVDGIPVCPKHSITVWHKEAGPRVILDSVL